MLEFKVDSWYGRCDSADELETSLAELRILIDDQAVSRAFDTYSRTVRDNLYVPAYPLAEWLATNWWFLLYEYEPVASRPNYAERHCLRFAGDGFALPDLCIVSTGQTVLLQSQQRKLRYQPLEFLVPLKEFCPLADLAQAMSNFIRTVDIRLRECGLYDTYMQQTWMEVQEAGGDEGQHAFCRIAAALGVQPAEVSDDLAETLVRAEDWLGLDTLHEFCATITVSDAEFAFRSLGQIDERLRADAIRLHRLPEMRRSASAEIADALGEHVPWRRGSLVAAALRRRLGLDDAPIEDTVRLMSLFGSDSTTGVLSEQALHHIDAVVREPDDAEQEAGPSVFTTKRHETSRKFALSRAIYEYMRARAPGIRLATRVDSEHQKANRAFAAEFLAPATGIARRIEGRRVVDHDDIEDIAAYYSVSNWTIENQIRNNNLAGIAYS